LAALAALLASACSSADAAQDSPVALGQAEQAIIGGELDESTAGVVGLWAWPSTWVGAELPVTAAGP
jgi:hypothetical protein